MSELQNLYDRAAVEKLRELADRIDICMFCTGNKLPLDCRPMSTLKVDDDGFLYFFSSARSFKNHAIVNNDLVQLFYANPEKFEFMDLYGTATVTRDMMLIDELWNDLHLAWFPDGKDDPTLTVITVRPELGYYWDTKQGVMVSFLKILTAAATGKTMDGGIEGELSL